VQIFLHAGSIQKQEATVEKKKAAGISAEVCPCKKSDTLKGNQLLMVARL
jgi:DNA topoisomerase-3